MKALRFLGLRRSIWKFVNTCHLDDNCVGIKASTVLDLTQLGRKYEVDTSGLISHLYVSPEFIRTVELKKGEKNDNFTVCP